MHPAPTYLCAHKAVQLEPIPSPVGLPNPGIELGSPALQADSLPTELSGTANILISKPLFQLENGLKRKIY